MGKTPKNACKACGQAECQCRQEETDQPPLEKRTTTPVGPDDGRLRDMHAVARITAERLLHERLLHEKRQRGEWEKLREFERHYEPTDME